MRKEELEFYDLSTLYRLFKALYLHIYLFIVHTGERKDIRKSDTERPGIPPQAPWFFHVPGAQLRYTGPTFYVLIRRTKLGKSCRCLRKHRTQFRGWYSNPVPRVLQFAPLPLSYLGSLHVYGFGCKGNVYVSLPIK